MRIVLVAQEAAGVQVLRRLAAAACEVVAVFTDDEPGARGATVARTAHHLGLAVRPAAEVREPGLARWLRREGVDLLLNVHSLHIVHPDVLLAPPLGAYNLHPGPLPEYAGLNVVAWALYRGEKHHGVTLHRMVPEVDAGTIAYRETFAVGPRDGALAVMTSCVRSGIALVERLVETAAAGEPIPAAPQELSRRRWFDRGPPNEGRLAWDAGARRIVDFVRACDWDPFDSPWDHPRTRAARGEVRILRAVTTGRQSTAPPGTVAGHDEGAVLVASADEWVRVDRVAVSGARTDAAAVLRAGERLSAV